MDQNFGLKGCNRSCNVARDCEPWHWQSIAYEPCCKLSCIVSCIEVTFKQGFEDFSWKTIGDVLKDDTLRHTCRYYRVFYLWIDFESSALSTIKEQQSLCKIQCVDIYYIWYVYFLLSISSWGIGCCNDTYVQNFFLEGHGEKTIPERYPNKQFESLGQEVARPPTHMNKTLTH